MTFSHSSTLFSRNRITVIGLICWLLYLLALLFPEAWWGLHFMAFLPTFWKFTIPVIALGLVFFSQSVHTFLSKLVERANRSGFPFLRAALLVTILMGVLYVSFPMYESIYGDAEYFQERMGERTTEWSAKYPKSFFTPNIFHPKTGNFTVLSAVRMGSFLTGLTHKQVFRVMGALCGMVFVFLWLRLIEARIQRPVWKVLLGLIGVSAPFTQFFFGYEEIYAPAFPITLAYQMAILTYFEKNDAKWLWGSWVFLFLCLKVHSVYVLFIPGSIMTTLWHARGRMKWVEQLFSWRNVALWVLLPITAIGAFMYFFVLKDYNDLRFLGEDVDIYSRLFLPIISPPPPLDRYTLLHGHHFFDYANMMFLWSGSALFLLGAIVVGYRKKINWNQPELLITGLSLTLLVMIFFVYNPLMSMPMDMDLFSLPGPVLLVFTLLLISHLQDTNFSSRAAGSVIGLCLLAIPVFMVNANRDMLSYRVEAMGLHVFKTYHIRAAGDIEAGIALIDEDRELYLSRLLSAVEKLEPYALRGNDKEYANLLWQVARFYRTAKKTYDTALDYHRQAWAYDHEMIVNYVGLMESAYMLGSYQEAYDYSKPLLANQYPSKQKALRIAIECAFRAEMFAESLQHCATYLSTWPDQDILDLQKRMRAEINK